MAWGTRHHSVWTIGPRSFRAGYRVQLRTGRARHPAEPLLIIEILSPLTERDDLFAKLPAYQGARSRSGWVQSEIGGVEARLRLDIIGLYMALGDAYRGVPSLGR
ncbi:MAG: Uma2 family endonuclease [Alphaproteobacteria bacterium]|nr:Uma2 family endonuclease [Alphaproteobacteria bacterium]